MISDCSKLARGIFLLSFTKELIRNSKNYEIYKLEALLRNKYPTRESKLEEIKEKIMEPGIRPKASLVSKDEKRKISEKEFIQELKTPLPVYRPRFEEVFSLKVPQKIRRQLIIPKTRLPPHLQYLKPVVSNEQISLNKLDPFVSDGNVKTIECTGTGEGVFVSGSMGKKPTGIALNEEEIREVISNFSNATKIPVGEGVTKMVLGNLILTAIVSHEAGSQFVIKKLEPPMGRRY